mgnify:CR=1 FL=1
MPSVTVLRVVAWFVQEHHALHNALRIDKDMRLTVDAIFANPVGPDVAFEVGDMLDQRGLAKVVVHVLTAVLADAQALEVRFLQHLLHAQQLLHCGKSFRVYSNPDFIGVQLGGAVKNVIAIGAGMSDGIGFGANARTALITRGLAEMSRLGAALGADPATFMGMAGLGDLVLTCTDNQSRNRRFGMMLGQGMDVQSAQEKIGQVVEGYRNTKEVRELAHRFGVEMPITEEIYQVLYCGKNAREAALTLLGRARKDERSSH